MALTEFQRTVCRFLAERRVASGESYVAGAAALNELIGVDLFHDTDEALAASWESDERVLSDQGFEIRVVRERPSYVEAEISRDGETLLMEWARDSAYRFFPLLRHPDLGLTLHAFDLSTNKVLALVGRLEVRDWVDVIYASERIQPLGYLAWAACGKDPAFSPSGILEQAALDALSPRRDLCPVVRGGAARPGRSRAPLAGVTEGGPGDHRHASTGRSRPVRP